MINSRKMEIVDELAIKETFKELYLVKPDIMSKDDLYIETPEGEFVLKEEVQEVYNDFYDYFWDKLYGFLLEHSYVLEDTSKGVIFATAEGKEGIALAIQEEYNVDSVNFKLVDLDWGESEIVETKYAKIRITKIRKY